VRDNLPESSVRWVYYGMLGLYVVWSYFCAWLFGAYGSPKLMFLVIANFNNLALGLTALAILRNNLRMLPPPLRPGWAARAGMVACALFYFGLAWLVFLQTQLPALRGWLARQ